MFRANSLVHNGENSVILIGEIAWYVWVHIGKIASYIYEKFLGSYRENTMVQYRENCVADIGKIAWNI